MADHLSESSFLKISKLSVSSSKPVECNAEFCMCVCVFNFWFSLVAALILFKLKSSVDHIIVHWVKQLINQLYVLKVCLNFDIGSLYLHCACLVWLSACYWLPPRTGALDAGASPVTLSVLSLSPA